MTYFSQIGQDKYFIEHFTDPSVPGYFVDVGAHDGIHMSNTYALELRGWRGLGIEVNDDLFAIARQRRACTMVNECVFSKSGEEKVLEIPLANPISEGNSLLTRIKDLRPDNPSFRDQFRETKTFVKRTKTLTQIFDEQSVPSFIDYMSIDIEGADYDALLGLDFSKYTIRFLTIEFGGNQAYLKQIQTLLESHGYRLHRVNRWDAEFRKAARSFDIFDTLIARRVEKPSDIHGLVEEASGYAGFRRMRQTAEQQSNGTFDSIYEHFQLISSCSNEQREAFKALELQTEISSSYLIRTNNDRVKDGDILVSDMYHSEATLRTWLDALGFRKRVEIFVTPGGKSNGTIWPVLKRLYVIISHLGDNPHSDVASPRAAGLEGNLTYLHRTTSAEQCFLYHGYPSIAFSLREFRHANPYPPESIQFQLYLDQTTYNIPFLLVLSTRLHQYLAAEGRTKVLFLTRDCCLLERIFPLLYPQYTCVHLESSRYIHKNPSEDYKVYLRETYKHATCLIVDVNGSFHSGRALYKELFGIYPRVHIVSYNGVSPLYEGLTYSVQKMPELESLNMDTNGSLLKYTSRDRLRAPLNYTSDHAAIYTRTVASFCEWMHAQKVSFHCSIDLDRFAQTVPFRKSSLPSFVDDAWHFTLTALANHHGSDKGDAIGFAHNFTLHYETLLLPFYNRPFSLLEIGLNGKGTDEIPSLAMWRRYFCNQVSVYGFDVDPKFQRHHKPASGVTIITGHQGRSKELEPCLEHTYNVIIDDGSHASRHQQTSLETLWPALRSGGVYCIEHLNAQPPGDTEPKMRDVLSEWQQGRSVFGTEIEAQILRETASITFYKSFSSRIDPDLAKTALCVLQKS